MEHLLHSLHILLRPFKKLSGIFSISVRVVFSFIFYICYYVLQDSAMRHNAPIGGHLSPTICEFNPRVG